MINVGIIGGETEAAGELIRILLNHPDVILQAVSAPALAGMRLDRYHRGLIGDTDLCFTKDLDGVKLNCVFLLGEPWQAQEYMRGVDAVSHTSQDEDSEPEDLLHIIDLTGSYRDGSCGMVYGFPEYRRKALVRGALRASLPSPIAIALEAGLFPLAKNHMLNGRIDADAELFRRDDEDCEVSVRRDPVAPCEKRPDAESVAGEVARELRHIDASFGGSLQVRLSSNPRHSRGLIARIGLPAGLNADEVRKLYEEAYSDHSFSFVIDREPEIADVSNTNKCLIHIAEAIAPANKFGNPLDPHSGLTVTVAIDNLLKGSAGNAVHCMNLLFGLSERTGLQLKASAH